MSAITATASPLAVDTVVSSTHFADEIRTPSSTAFSPSSYEKYMPAAFDTLTLVCPDSLP